MRSKVHSSHEPWLVYDGERGVDFGEIDVVAILPSVTAFQSQHVGHHSQFVHDILGWKRLIQPQTDHLPGEIALGGVLGIAGEAIGARGWYGQ